MPELSEGAQDLAERVVESERPVVFLFGAALTMQMEPGQAGVPDVRGMVAKLEVALGERRDAAFDAAVEAGDYGEAYRRGFAVLVKRRGQDGVNRVIREGVLEAHAPLDEARRATVLASHPSDSRRACDELLNEVDGWLPLRASVDALGRMLATDRDRFRRVLTTNFDPLVEVAVLRAGGSAHATVLDRDGAADQHRGPGTHVVYLHGYWSGADTLHSDVQLTKSRPKLEATLRRWIERSLLVVLGYGGWDDVLMTSLQAVAADDGAFPDIAWGCYREQDKRVAKKLAAAGERVQFYENVDLHALLPVVAQRLGSAPSARPVAATAREQKVSPEKSPATPRTVTGPDVAAREAEHAIADATPTRRAVGRWAAWLVAAAVAAVGVFSGVRGCTEANGENGAAGTSVDARSTDVESADEAAAGTVLPPSGGGSAGSGSSGSTSGGPGSSMGSTTSSEHATDTSAGDGSTEGTGEPGPRRRCTERRCVCPGALVATLSNSMPEEAPRAVRLRVRVNENGSLSVTARNAADREAARAVDTHFDGVSRATVRGLVGDTIPCVADVTWQP